MKTASRSSQNSQLRLQGETSPQKRVESNREGDTGACTDKLVCTYSNTLHTKAARQTQNTINDRYWYLIRLCVFAAVFSQSMKCNCVHTPLSLPLLLGHLDRLLGKASLHFCQFLTSLLGFSYLELGIFYSRGSKSCLIAGH